MKVDVVRLRRNGVKLASGEVKAAVPLRAVLSINTLNGVDQHGGQVRSTSAQLLDDAGVVVSTMAHAEVTSMSGDSFIVSGTEVSTPSIGSGETWPQSWWCRVVRP
jgi:hypothetical protein